MILSRPLDTWCQGLRAHPRRSQSRNPGVGEGGEGGGGKMGKPYFISGGLKFETPGPARDQPGHGQLDQSEVRANNLQRPLSRHPQDSRGTTQGDSETLLRYLSRLTRTPDALPVLPALYLRNFPHMKRAGSKIPPCPAMMRNATLLSANQRTSGLARDPGNNIGYRAPTTNESLQHQSAGPRVALRGEQGPLEAREPGGDPRRSRRISRYTSGNSLVAQSECRHRDASWQETEEHRDAAHG